YLAQAEAARLLQQLVSAGENGRLQHGGEQVVGQVAETVLRDAFVSFEVEVVENLATVLVGDGEDREAQERGGTLLKAAEQARLITGVEAKGVDQVGA